MADEPLIRDVSDTARWVAAYRAQETERPDAAFRDPFARALAGERGEAIVQAIAKSGDFSWPLVARTYLFDRYVARLVKAGVDLIVSVSAQGLPEAKSAIASVPVVMAASSFPVERGLVASLAHPGGNITGMATFTGEMFAKRIQLLVEALPGVSRVAILRLPGAQNDVIVRDFETAARRFNLNLQILEVAKPDDFAVAFRTAARSGAQAIMTAQGPFFDAYSALTADLALKHRLPGFSGEPDAADAGMLLTHGASIPASCQRSALFVDRILKGAKPADLPVEQTTKFDLEINLKTAKALGVTIPHSLLLRADRIIE